MAFFKRTKGEINYDCYCQVWDSRTRTLVLMRLFKLMLQVLNDYAIYTTQGNGIIIAKVAIAPTLYDVKNYYKRFLRFILSRMGQF